VDEKMKMVGVLFLFVALIMLIFGGTYMLQGSYDEALSDEDLHPSDPAINSGVNTTEQAYENIYNLYYGLPFILLLMFVLSIFVFFKYLL